jgi:hypothetical protein
MDRRRIALVLIAVAFAITIVVVSAITLERVSTYMVSGDVIYLITVIR